MGISEPEAIESLEVLDNDRLVKIRRTLGAGLSSMRRFVLTSPGLEIYLRSYETRYSEIVTRDAVGRFLDDKVAVTAPKGFFDVTNVRAHDLAQSAGREALQKGLERFVYVQQRTHETKHLTPTPVTDHHANFPMVKTETGPAPAYRLEVPEHLVKQIDDLIADLEAGNADLEDLAEPLPRLHVDAHLYNPLLVKESDVDETGQQRALLHPVSVRTVPSGLVQSEVVFLRDLQAFWKGILDDSAWEGHEIYLLRNLPRKGVGFFETAGFYPDFMLWLKKGDAQALAFVEPHGMVIWDQTKVDLLQDIRGLGQSVPTVAYIVTPTSPKSVGAIGSKSGDKRWLRDRHILLQSDPTYIGTILEDLRRALVSIETDQYEAGRPVARFRLVSREVLNDAEIAEEEKFSKYAPVHSIRAAAGAFGSGEVVDLEGWLPIDGRLTKEHFVATAVGRSMEPLIADGDLLLFRRYMGGTRQGKVVLAQWAGPEVPDTGGSYAVKRCHRHGERGEKETTIELQSDNPEFDSILLKPEYEDDVGVIAEFVEVLRPPL